MFCRVLGLELEIMETLVKFLINGFTRVTLSPEAFAPFLYSFFAL